MHEVICGQAPPDTQQPARDSTVSKTQVTPGGHQRGYAVPILLVLGGGKKEGKEIPRLLLINAQVCTPCWRLSRSWFPESSGPGYRARSSTFGYTGAGVVMERGSLVALRGGRPALTPAAMKNTCIRGIIFILLT